MTLEATPTEDGRDTVDDDTAALDMFIQAVAHATLIAHRMEELSVREVTNVLDQFLTERLPSDDPYWEPLLALCRLYLVTLDMTKIDFELDELLPQGEG